jgi:hypothetical protein
VLLREFTYLYLDSHGCVSGSGFAGRAVRKAHAQYRSTEKLHFPVIFRLILCYCAEFAGGEDRFTIFSSKFLAPKVDIPYTPVKLVDLALTSLVAIPGLPRFSSHSVLKPFYFLRVSSTSFFAVSGLDGRVAGFS